jgi:hypothetical protein
MTQSAVEAARFCFSCCDEAYLRFGKIEEAGRILFGICVVYKQDVILCIGLAILMQEPNLIRRMCLQQLHALEDLAGLERYQITDNELKLSDLRHLSTSNQSLPNINMEEQRTGRTWRRN